MQNAAVKIAGADEIPPTPLPHEASLLFKILQYYHTKQH